MPAWEHHGVFSRSVAFNALLLGFVFAVHGCCVINSVNIIEVHDLVVVEELLLQELEPDVVRTVLLELPVGVLDVLPALTLVVVRVHSLYGDDNRVEVLAGHEEILVPDALAAIGIRLVLREINYTHFASELLT